MATETMLVRFGSMRGMEMHGSSKVMKLLASQGEIGLAYPSHSRVTRSDAGGWGAQQRHRGWQHFVYCIKYGTGSRLRLEWKCLGAARP